MTVLGIDPGPVTSHWATFDGRCIEAGSFSSDEPGAWPASYDAAAIEKVASYGMAVGSEVFETCFVSGRFYEFITDNIFPEQVARPTRKEIVVELCGSSKAKDSNVRQYLIDRFGPPGTKNNPGTTYGIVKDQWQALAVAVYAWDVMHK